jgi:hypothetical protein
MSCWLDSILKEAWNTAANTEDKREKIQALSLAKDCYSMKLDLLTNASVVDDAIRFVSERQQELLESKQKDGGKIRQQQPDDDNTGITLNKVF